MDQIYELLAITLGAILANNFIFSQFLGICPFLGVSKKVDTAVGMGIAVTFVMGLASAVCYAVNEFVLVRFGLEYMQTVTFILVIASLVQFVEMFLQKSMPSLYTALGIYLPLITTNCAVLGVVLLNVQNNYNFIESVVYGVTGGLGFLLAIVLFASIRERLVFADYPKAFEGFPIALVTAGLRVEPAWLLEAENNVLRRGQDIDELEMLVDHADAEIKRVLRRADDDLLVVDEELPLIRKIYAGEHIHERGLAAAVFAEQGEDLAAIDVQPDLVVCDDRTEGLRNVAHSHCGMLAVQRRQLLAVRCKEIILYSVV